MSKPVDAVDHLYNLYIRGDADAEARYDHELKKLRLIDQIRDLRERAGFSHADLARKLGMKTAAVAELENPDSDGHSLENLQQVVSALGMELELKIVKKTGIKRRTKTAGRVSRASASRGEARIDNTTLTRTSR